MALKYDKKKKRWIDENGDAMRYGYGRWDKNLKQMLQYNSDGTITHYSKKEWEDKQEKLMRIRAQKLTEKRKQAERKYFIPYIKDKFITISGNNKDTGAVISTNMLDSIAKYSRQAGIPFKDGLGLVAQESTLGNAPNRGIGYQFRHSNSNGTWSPKRSNYNGWSPVLITSDWDYIDRNPYSDYKIDRNGVTPQPYSTIRSTLEKGENFEINIPPLLHAFELFKSGDYNPGDKRHTRMVQERGKKLIQTSPEIQSWMKSNCIIKLGGTIRKKRFSVK